MEKSVSDGDGHKKKYRNYSASDIIEAARLVQQENFSIYKAAIEKNIPWSSLKRFVSDNRECRTTPSTSTGLKKMGRPFALDVELQQKVFNYIINMQELGFGLTVNQVKVIAFDVAEASGRGHFFNREKKCASKKWWMHFKQRYGLTLRVPENLSAYRASMANLKMVDDYFDKLTDTMAKLNIQHKPEDHVWNVDETGIMYVVKPGKVVTEIGKKFIYRRSYGERGETMTLVGCVCANGTWIPPFIIFKGVRWNSDFKKDCLPNTQVHFSEKGWITKELFIIWFKFFLESTTGSPKPILMLMDSHRSHITPEVIELARANDVHLLTFPSHTTHILQPLDVGVYKALKCAWQKELYQYMNDHPMEKPNKTNFHEIFKVPFVKAMSTKNITNAFRSCGIVPLNRDAIPKEKLAPSLLTEQAAPDLTQCNRPIAREPVCSIIADVGSSLCEQIQSSPADVILKVPTPGPRPTKKNSRPSSSRSATLITSRPTPDPTVKKPQQSSEKLRRHKKTFSASSARPSGTANSVSNDEDWTCGACNQKFSSDMMKKNGKKWVQCSFCLIPYHELCQSEPVTNLVYMCDLCTNGDD